MTIREVDRGLNVAASKTFGDVGEGDDEFAHLAAECLVQMGDFDVVGIRIDDGDMGGRAVDVAA